MAPRRCDDALSGARAVSGISDRMRRDLAGSSWIRKMYDEGERLRAEFGADAIADLALGNPMVEPPAEYGAALARAVADTRSGTHRYMPNAGYPDVRAAVADGLRREFGLNFEGRHIVMTVGAAGAINIVLKAILDEGDEVIILAPYFTEYPYYVENHGGRAIIIPPSSDFLPDAAAIAKAMTSRTRAILVNSPNNPSGRVFPRDALLALVAAVRDRHSIQIISDDPYRRIVYDGVTPPNIFEMADDVILCTSFSKDLAIPGERLGYAAVSPRSPFADEILQGMTFANRTLGFVNAPALQQRAIAGLSGICVDPSVYARKRDRLTTALRHAGYRFAPPEGAFYLFVAAPGGDDVAFTSRMVAERVLVVPGVAFGAPGYVRVAYCADDAAIERAIAGFQRVA
ncbi:MAG: pyridoxal phosphate-dependent aminotransferase [Deltaproteobacteria bacterium]|nr:pyridoxal phosphate-dependent aminotransferase [Deltaproteobacteria bacterium]